jgi:deoxycytidylate deaminase
VYNKDENPHVVWLLAAAVVAQTSTCTRDKVGAIVVDRGVISSGYNEIKHDGRLGGPRPLCGLGDCPRGKLSIAQHPRGGDYSNCFAMHAEVMAIRSATFRRKPSEHTLLYVTREPCHDCWVYILGSDIIESNVFWRR